MHKPGQIISRKKKRPRITQKNRSHVREIWGTEGVVSISIPTLIDDYNHWIGGVDVSDQRIA